jgi:hypothetical protein
MFIVHTAASAIDVTVKRRANTSFLSYISQQNALLQTGYFLIRVYSIRKSLLINAF